MLAPPLLMLALLCPPLPADGQPRVAAGPVEPDWIALLDALYGLSMSGDLLNPVVAAVEDAPGLFRKAGPGPVTYMPVLALGLETVTRGGWYPAGPDRARAEIKRTWSYRFKSTGRDVEAGGNLRPPLLDGSTIAFDPGARPFGLWVGNDGLADGGVFTEPARVAAANARLAGQPYKAMIYPNRDKATGKDVPNSYLIGWEYSTNDDFQDAVCRVENVILIR